MRYLGRAWRLGYTGPRRDPDSGSLWAHLRRRGMTLVIDEEKVLYLHGRWLRVADKDRYSAVVLLWHYRDRDPFPDKLLHAALDQFALA